MIKQLGPEEWVGDSEVSCSLPRTYVRVIEAKGFLLYEDYYDIFEDILYAAFSIDSEHRLGIMLSRYIEEFDIHIYTSNQSPEQDILNFLDCLDLDTNDLSWHQECLDFSRFPCFEVWRMDDHGNEFFVATCRTHGKAKRLERMFTERGHKQTYWIRSPEDRSGDRNAHLEAES